MCNFTELFMIYHLPDVADEFQKLKEKNKNWNEHEQYTQI